MSVIIMGFFLSFFLVFVPHKTSEFLSNDNDNKQHNDTLELRREGSTISIFYITLKPSTFLYLRKILK